MGAAHVALQGGGFEIVVMDLGLPRLDGLEVLRRVRAAGDGIPVLVISATDADPGGVKNQRYWLALSAENPAWGCGRIASQLRLEGIQLSSPTVQGGRRRDQLAETGHYLRWREDFALCREIGTRYLRYGIPYYSTHLGPGRYAAYCFITDRDGGKPHALKGMVDEFEVE